MAKKAIIIGAGPAGLTAAYELLKRTDIHPIILEKSGDIGGISKTINYKGNRMDIGGHRFFSKSDRVMNWWMNIMPLQQTEEQTITINYQNKARTIASVQATIETDQHEGPGKVMLLRKRLSRIYFLRKFFTYPIQLSIDTLRKLGIVRTIHILLSYIYAQLIPRKPEKSLEDFLINRFGRQLYLLFFKDYTEKVWGVPCHEISAEWGAQRIKGVSISKAIRHAAQMMVKKKQKASSDIAQKDTETSLIEQFLYPALGPGQLWEEVARQVQVMGGTIIHHQHVKEIASSQGRITGITAVNTLTAEETVYEGDYFFSTMPIKDLIAGMNGEVPADVRTIAAGLQYRDFITVGVLLEKLCATDPKTGEIKELDLQDTWIYIQEKDVKVGRLQLFNNWSPYMVNKPGNVWIGMEYFCNEGDAFWSLTDSAIKRTAIAELEQMGLAQVEDVLDSTVHRVEKTYPAYFGTYDQFDKIREFVDEYDNLFLVGRNGMHKYNNADHSMLTAMTAVDNICEGVTSKANIWAINTEQEYHEEKNTVKDEKALEEPHSEPEAVLTFKEFLFKNKRNKVYLWLAGVAVLIQFAVFKYLYPFASFINDDSYVYLQTAYYNLSINVYPVGYPNFLRLFSVFTKSDLALVAFQYMLLQASQLTLIFSLFYFYKPNRSVQVCLLVLLIFNPALLYLANYISSDNLFISLSLLWVTSLLWIIYRPTLYVIVAQAFILFLAFTVRYNALFYPIITIIAFHFSRISIQRKVFGSMLGILFIGLFIFNTGLKYKKYLGTWQFAPFSGWQMANNAIHLYRSLPKEERKPVPAKFQVLDKMVIKYFDSTNPLKFMVERQRVTPAYMWTPSFPLQKYMKQHSKADSLDIFKQWASVGQFYDSYARYLIRTYPLNYLRSYIWPNMVNYYAPPVEFLSDYSTGKDTVQQIAQIWFGYKSNKLKTKFKNFEVRSLNFLPILAGALTLLFLLSVLYFRLLPAYRYFPELRKGVIVVFMFWLVNFAFSTYASPISLRFQLFPMILTTIFTVPLIKIILDHAKAPKESLQLPINILPNKTNEVIGIKLSGQTLQDR